MGSEDRHKTVFDCRWYNHLRRKFEKNRQKYTETNKQLQQGCRVQDYNIENSIAAQYTNKEKVESEIINKTLFILVPPAKWNI